MLLLRTAILLLLLVAGAYFALYIGTGQLRYRRSGLIILTGTLVAALVFFGMLILERVF